MKPSKRTVFKGTSVLVLLLCAVFLAQAQIPAHVPSKERVDATAKRRTEIDGNNVRASIFNYLFAGRLGVGQGVAFEWPKNTKREYIALVALFIGGEVVDDNGNTIRIVDLPAFRSNPADGSDWNMLPIPGYFNAQRPGGGIIAKSDDPTSWPAIWPDKLADQNDPGWPGKWNGYYGKDQFSADQEMYYRVGDDNYNRFNYTPDTTDRTRKGLGLVIDSRVMQWSQISVQDATFFIHEIKNDGTKDIRKVGTTIWLADVVGGDGDSQDDMPDFDLRQAVAFSLDKDAVSSNPAFQNAQVGAVATSFLETPGNAVDRIDNDGDSPENPQTGGGPAVTRDMLVGETSGNGTDDNGNGLIDEDSTFITFGTQKAVTFADGIDNNGNGEDSSPVITQQMINDAAIDQWHRWPPNPETDPIQGGLDGKPITHLINVVQSTLGQKIKDNIDNNGNSNGYSNLPRITQSMIDQAAADRYHRYRVPGTNVILYNLDHSSLGKRYLNLDGLRDGGVDERIDEIIDESRDDGVDNNGDWNPLTDDVGLDGKDGTGDFGENDGIPTSGAGTPFPGEPHVDKTDVKEADMIGVTNVQYDRAGGINFNTTADVYYWASFMSPGKFVDPAVLKQVVGTSGGDFDLFVGSGFFPLKAGQIERVSYSVVMGNATQKGDADQSGAKADALRKRAIAQQAYNENYQFATVPLEPHVTSVAESCKVTLYWDNVAEKTVDRFLLGVTGSGATFEGYRVYRSTDPAFQDATIITDAYGNPAPFKKPIAQFDLKDGIKGFSPIAYNGVQFDLGNDTGLQHAFIDSTVQNGQKYYYSVRAYTKGYAPYDIAPSESNLRISIDNTTGEVKEIGSSVAIVVPNAPVGGYTRARSDAVRLVAGTTTGTVGNTIVDPRYVRNATYRVTFEDTILAGRGSAPDTFLTSRMTLADVTNRSSIDTLISRSTSVADTIEQPVIEGFRLGLKNETTIALDPTRSSWTRSGIMNLQFVAWENGSLVGQRFPNDYQVVFGAVGTDTSLSYPVTEDGGYVAPAVPVNFTVRDTYNNRKVPFAFVELDPSSEPGILSAVFDPDRPGSSRSDIVILVERNKRDSTVITWAFSVLFDSSRALPKTGDTAKIYLTKPFRSRDQFEFTTKAQGVDPALASNSLNRIKVVPNPYVAAATWEERNPFNTGRGPRSIHFNHLPQVCTIRIYTVSGELVTTIVHNSTQLDGTAEWNLLTRDNLSVSYGIYIYHVDAPGTGETIGKFAVIK